METSKISAARKIAESRQTVDAGRAMPLYRFTLQTITVGQLSQISGAKVRFRSSGTEAINDTNVPLASLCD
jgi:hypothetical protein